MPLELFGDSARGDRYAAASLVVQDGRIAEADTPGISRSLVGLTLLDAAAVPGEQLAADALANAIASVVAAPPAAERIAVAMSGGVDSAVALRRAGRDAVGVTLRLWLDPRGPDAERACCSPDAVIRARETCHALGIPHVTLDLRAEFRRTVVQTFIDGYANGLTPNPCMRWTSTATGPRWNVTARSHAGPGRRGSGSAPRISRRRRVSRPSSSATRRSTCSHSSARSRTSATEPSSRSCASRRSIPRAVAR